ncbi:adenine-specific DNA-methyltransferase [Ereboglobus sp. PH5-5]|uniref:DNA adenine methylase n=1 Tax=Ereboglobus sp. PH5-5 TaxID=2940529 RepID=UPI0024061CEB|nr:DNA adenine methylase [Ereboglobus sp. PH5-5]MDF9832238.1 adenine-specific DNA-methyltransferase [Ereboglobus sp. PH5-5]
MIDPQKIPHLMKYMGSKREILEFILSSVKDLNIKSEWFCDLFAGTAVVGCSLRDKYNLQINDIQTYSSVFANTYLMNLGKGFTAERINEIEAHAKSLVAEFYSKYPELKFPYFTKISFDKLSKIEKKQQNLINKEFDVGFHLFTKYYSGTYWSFDQCVWIDSIRAIAEECHGTPEFYIILSSLIYAMSYTSQGTGHFAQFRDVNKENMSDILIYRCRDIWPLFEKKFNELINVLTIKVRRKFRITSLDYLDCLRIIEENSIVYADPPYSSVHYSRFYHAIETLVRYDYPHVKYKGRYREDRHQSPFSKKTEVASAFKLLFENIKLRKSHIILSYSDNGMIPPKDILRIGKDTLGRSYSSKIFKKGHKHSKMGRSDEHNMEVNELLISFKRN